MWLWLLFPSLRLAVAGLLLAATLVGCASTERVTVADLSFPPPAVAPLPLRIGVYYPPALRNGRNTSTLYDQKYEFSIGAATIAAFDAVLAAMFDEVVPVQRPPTLGASDGDLAGTIEVTEVRGGVTSTGAVVTYDIILYGSGGERRTAWSVGGTAPHQADVASTVRAAMRDGAAAFIVGFRERLEVQAWLAQVGVLPSSARPPSPSGGQQ